VVPQKIRHERNKILRTLSYSKMQYFTRLHNGQTRKVLFEKQGKNGIMEGYTDNYIKISLPYQQDWANRIIDWKIQ
jgi:threonylcarbamoyladenosine tRNA methylthiotransferase MtaB